MLECPMRSALRLQNSAYVIVMALLVEGADSAMDIPYDLWLKLCQLSREHIVHRM